MSTHKIKTAADIIKMMHGEFASLDGKVNEPVTNAMNRYADMLDAAFARQGIDPSATMTGSLRLPKDPAPTVAPSPLPWRVNGSAIESDDPRLPKKNTVATVSTLPKTRKKGREESDALAAANARLIVRAVNALATQAEERRGFVEAAKKVCDNLSALVRSNSEVRTAVDKMRVDQTRLISAVSDVRDIAASLPLLESGDESAS